MTFDSKMGCAGFPLAAILSRRADAAAVVTGSDAEPQISGVVRFYQTDAGVLISAQICGLPDPTEDCGDRVFGFHIHSGTACEGTPDAPFTSAGTHYDGEGCTHPHHAGDLPPLFGNHGLAVCAVLTSRFTVREILGRTVIIHSDRDDFTTDPSGSAGSRIACGVIRRNCANCRWV